MAGRKIRADAHRDRNLSGIELCQHTRFAVRGAASVAPSRRPRNIDVMKAHSLFARVVISLLLLSPAARADWPQYRGPSQNGVSAEKGFNAAAASAPAVLWKAN